MKRIGALRAILGIALLIMTTFPGVETTGASFWPTDPVEIDHPLPDVGMSVNFYEDAMGIETTHDGNIVTTTIDFGVAYLAVSIRPGEFDGGTAAGWSRAQRYSINVPATLGVDSDGFTSTGIHARLGDVYAVCDRAETVCYACPDTRIGDGTYRRICPTNRGIADPVRWYHEIMTMQGPNGVIVGDYFCDTESRGIADCDAFGTATLTTLNFTG